MRPDQTCKTTLFGKKKEKKYAKKNVETGTKINIRKSRERTHSLANGLRQQTSRKYFDFPKRKQMETRSVIENGWKNVLLTFSSVIGRIGMELAHAMYVYFVDVYTYM